ncbi:hypothetical protein BDV27DRAFT_61692 [Aspergillus caelatus]|uniref:Zn(2)-C6 fungal-type domain-containing protein n=2 Tax=Aspergillus subgen. Circumdati TaxID=2720871 RepID=A0A5N7AMK7_9EURO|nr:uncharacterized protein BDV27DRAFT_61692 [Aspergillus caelatus]KAE8370476.1 hypothetical protein BDV27DRAFT_61692 [Aspergillus caelatus]KAE8415632.1 hypothetical protein BDV36DRAFT_262458 [Aspergillus pseudocaelatus]
MTGRYYQRRLAPKEELPPTPDDHSPAEQSKRKRASLACLECQRRRIKCGPGRPCEPCLLNRRECIYNECNDKRRKISAEATEQNLKFYRSALENLLRAIQIGSKSDVDHIINDIRKGAPLSEISRIAAECLNDIATTTTTTAPDLAKQDSVGNPG